MLADVTTPLNSCLHYGFVSQVLPQSCRTGSSVTASLLSPALLMEQGAVIVWVYQEHCDIIDHLRGGVALFGGLEFLILPSGTPRRFLLPQLLVSVRV